MQASADSKPGDQEGARVCSWACICGLVGAAEGLMVPWEASGALRT